MLPVDAQIFCGDHLVSIKEVRETNKIIASVGWGEIGEAYVKDVYLNNVSNTPLLRLTTARGAVLRCTPDQLCFGRFNNTMRTYSIYLHERSTLGFRVGITDNIVHDAIGMMTANNSFDVNHTITDRLWVIENNSNLTSATFLFKFIASKYGLPDIPFNARQKDSMLNEQYVKKLFDGIDTPVRAKELLKDSNMFIEHPHLTVRLNSGDKAHSNSVQFTIFGSKEVGTNGRHSHFIQVQGTGDPNTSEQFKIYRGRVGNHGVWNIEVVREDLEEAELFVKTVSNLDDLEVVKKIQLTRKNSYYVLPASHLKRGMLVPILTRSGTIEEDVITKVENYEYEGPLYDLQVHDLYNFIVGQWVVMCYTPINKPQNVLL